MDAARIKTSDRLLITGRTGSGKSVLARAIFEATPPPRLLIDPKQEETTAYAVTFSDPLRLPDAPVARFLPKDPTDLEAYDALYGVVFVSGPRMVWLDEAPAVAPSGGKIQRQILSVLRMGRKRGIGHIATAQRPVWIARELLSESEHVICFATHFPDDLKVLAGIMAIAPRDLRSAMDRTPQFGFCWYAAREGVCQICPPIRR